MQLRSMPGRGAVVASIATIALLALAGCSQSAPSASEVSSDPVEGGVLEIVQNADISPTTFLAQNLPNLTFNRLVFNFLTQYDTESLEPQPELATAWEVSEDGRTVTLELRDDVTFHDGRPFTADDVIASIDLVNQDGVASQMKHVAALITDMAATSDTEVVLSLASPASNLFDLFEMMPIIDVNTADELLTGQTIIGTGPFQVEEYTPGQGVELVANEDYWQEGLPYLDGVNISVVRDSQSMLSSLRSGQSQLALNLTPLDATSLKSDPAFEVIASPAQDATYYVASNVEVPLLADKEVRQAIAYAIDRERILTQVLGDIGTVTSIPWSPSSPAFDEELRDTYSYDPERAGKMLEELGVAGSSVNLFYDSSSGPISATSEIVLFNLKEAGLDVTAVPLQSADFNDRLRNGGLDGLFVSGHGFGQLSPATLAKGAFPFNADRNASGFTDPAYTELANRLWQTTDPAELPEVYTEMTEYLQDQQFVSDLVTTSYTYTIASELEGIHISMLDYLDLDEAYLQ